MTITNKEDALRVVMRDGRQLKECSPELQADREVVLAAVRESGYALEYASADLRADREFILSAVSQNGDALRYASAVLQSDREVVLAAVRQNGHALRYASAALKNDRAVVLTAVSNDGYALQYASEALRNDREVVLAAVRQCPEVLTSVSKALRSDQSFLKQMVEASPKVIKRVFKKDVPGLLRVIDPQRVLGSKPVLELVTGLMTWVSLSGIVLSKRNSNLESQARFQTVYLYWKEDINHMLLSFLTFEDVLQLLQTDANHYVEAANGRKVPCLLKSVGLFSNQSLEDHISESKLKKTFNQEGKRKIEEAMSANKVRRLG